MTIFELTLPTIEQIFQLLLLLVAIIVGYTLICAAVFLIFDLLYRFMEG